MPCDTILALMGMSSGNHKLKLFRQLLNELEQTMLSPTCTECRWIKNTRILHLLCGHVVCGDSINDRRSCLGCLPLPLPLSLPFLWLQRQHTTYTTLSLSRGYLTMFCQESVSPFLVHVARFPAHCPGVCISSPVAMVIYSSDVIFRA